MCACTGARPRLSNLFVQSRLMSWRMLAASADSRDSSRLKPRYSRPTPEPGTEPSHTPQQLCCCMQHPQTPRKAHCSRLPAGHQSLAAPKNLKEQ